MTEIKKPDCSRCSRAIACIVSGRSPALFGETWVPSQAGRVAEGPGNDTELKMILHAVLGDEYNTQLYELTVLYAFGALCPKESLR